MTTNRSPVAHLTFQPPAESQVPGALADRPLSVEDRLANAEACISFLVGALISANVNASRTDQAPRVLTAADLHTFTARATARYAAPAVESRERNRGRKAYDTMLDRAEERRALAR